MSIASHVKVSASYTRSVNLERDSHSDNLNLGYIPTSRALRTLATITSRFSENDVPRAWSLVGPYGSGKSSFALFLSHLLADPSAKKTKIAQKILKKTSPELETSLRAETKGTQGYVEVLISGTPERLSMRYLRGLQEAMIDYWQTCQKRKKPTVFAEMAQFTASGEVSVSELVRVNQIMPSYPRQNWLPWHDDRI